MKMISVKIIHINLTKSYCKIPYKVGLKKFLIVMYAFI